MRVRLILFLGLASAYLSCGGVQPIDGSESAPMPPDFLNTTEWPDSPDLGVVVSSGVVATDAPPPPDFSR